MRGSKSKFQSRFREIKLSQIPVEFTEDALLRVQLIPDPKSIDRAITKSRRFWLLAWVSCPLIIIFSVFYMFSISQQTPIAATNSLSVSSFISYPTFISRGDECNIELTLANDSQNYISNMKAVLLCPKQISLKTDLNGGTSINFGDLNIGEIKTREIKFTLKKPTVEKYFYFKVNLIAGENESEISEEYYKITEFPIPYLRKILRYLFGLIGALIVSNIPVLLKGISSLRSLIF